MILQVKTIINYCVIENEKMSDVIILNLLKCHWSLVFLISSLIFWLTGFF